jgi:hypothetical protein
MLTGSFAARLKKGAYTASAKNKQKRHGASSKLLKRDGTR